MNDKNACEMPDFNPPSEELRSLLQDVKTIAIVGLSDNPERDSHRVGMYLKEHGYKIVPVNPGTTEILGEKSYPDLASIPERVDLVDIFRSIDVIPGIVDEAIKIRPKAIWMQLGLAHAESAKKARAHGIDVVQSKCVKLEHQRLFPES